MHTLAQKFLSERKRLLFYTRVLSAATRSVAHSASSPLRSSARCAEACIRTISRPFFNHFSPFSARFHCLEPGFHRIRPKKAREKREKIEKNSGRKRGLKGLERTCQRREPPLQLGRRLLARLHLLLQRDLLFLVLVRSHCRRRRRRRP